MYHHKSFRESTTRQHTLQQVAGRGGEAVLGAEGQRRAEYALVHDVEVLRVEGWKPAEHLRSLEVICTLRY